MVVYITQTLLDEVEQVEVARRKVWGVRRVVKFRWTLRTHESPKPRVVERYHAKVCCHEYPTLVFTPSAEQP